MKDFVVEDDYIEIANRCNEVFGEIKTITEEDFQRYPKTN